MARSVRRDTVAALAVVAAIALLAAAPAQAAAGRAGQGEEWTALPWAMARQAVERLWGGVLGAVREVRAVVEADGAIEPPGGGNGPGGPGGATRPRDSGDQGGAADPDG